MGVEITNRNASYMRWAYLTICAAMFYSLSLVTSDLKHGLSIPHWDHLLMVAASLGIWIRYTLKRLNDLRLSRFSVFLAVLPWLALASEMSGATHYGEMTAFMILGLVQLPLILSPSRAAVPPVVQCPTPNPPLK
jgi:uncharacterized membrane protein YhaH (DUF805 family)